MSTPHETGEVLAGRYRTVRILGMGAMGVVFEAVHVHLDQHVAVKVLKDQRSTNPEVHERFLREAKAAGSLRSQHVAHVSDYGLLDSGAPFLVMELLDGKDLAAVLEERGRLPIPEAVEYFLQVLEGVGEAHRKGIVHRDLKPANLFLTRDTGGVPVVKVLDFGVSKLGGDSLKITNEGAVLGSPLYMSPEQMLGKTDVDERSDIWALGAILYELVAGLSPFHSDTILALQTAVLVKPPVPLTQYLPDAPQMFEVILLQALDKSRERRWPDVATFAAALAPFAPPSAVHYVERVATARGVTVEASRPTDVLSLQSALRRASEPATQAQVLGMAATTNGASSMPASAPAKPRAGGRAAWVGVGLLAVVVAGVGVLRWRTEPAATVPPASAVPPQAEPEAGAGPVATMTVEPAATASASATASVTAAASPTGVPAAKGRVPMAGPVVPATPAGKPAKPKNIYED